jgi:hypothetical protein
MPLRILPHKVIKEECHPRVRREILMVTMPNLYEGVLLPLFAQYDAWLRLADKKVKLWVEYIKYKAKTVGYEVSPWGKACYREETTCLGKYPTHYPYFKITKPFRKYVRKSRERDFLREIGLTEEEIEEAESWFDTLAVIHQLRNGTAKGLDWLGVIEADFGEKEEVVEGHGNRERPE